MNFKRVIVFILLSLVSVSGVLFGCRGKYDNMKVTSDRDETGLQLYIGEDSELDGGATPSIGNVTFTVSGVGDDVSKVLKYNYDQSLVKILNEQKSGNQTTLTLQAISGGSTNFVAISEEGDKKDYVHVECIKRITKLEFNSDYNPAIFNEENSSLIINSRSLVFNEGTTQTEVTYNLVSSIDSLSPITIDGVELTKYGKLTLSKTISNNSLFVLVQSVADPSLHDCIEVHIIKPVKDDDISILTLSSLYKDNAINLTTEGVEKTITFSVQVDTTERNISFAYRLIGADNSSDGAVNCVKVNQNLNEFHIEANTIGTCKLIVEILFSDYSDIPAVYKTIDISVIKLPKTISVNGISTDFEDNIYTYYSNGVGKQYTIQIGDVLAYNKQFILVADNAANFAVKKLDGSSIKIASLNQGDIEGDYDILTSGSSIYITGNLANQTAKLYIYAYGSIGYSGLLVRTITLTTYLGSTSVTPIYSTLNDVISSTYFVEVGNSFELDYTIDENSSASGIKLLNSDNTPVSSTVEVNVSNGMHPVITVSGLEAGNLSCKLVLDNLVESEVFSICCFVPVDYVDDKNGGYLLSVDSPLNNRYIAEAHYDPTYNCLDYFVLSLGAGAQIHLATNPTNATIYSVRYQSILSLDETETDNSEFVSVNSLGFVVARKVLSNSDNSKVLIRVTVTSLVTDQYGNVHTVDVTKDVNVDVYIPLSSATLSKTTTTLYWYDNLNVVQIENNMYTDEISVSLFPNSVSKDKVKIKWDIGTEIVKDENDLSVKLSAYDMPENVAQTKTYTLTVTIQYYSAIIVKYATVNVVNPTLATSINTYVQDDYDNSTAYFDISNGLSGVQPIQIYTNVYSASGKQDVTFGTVYYLVEEQYKSIATVNANGLITPHSAGSFDVYVFAEDMISADYVATKYKTIHVIVADGKTSSTALRVRSQSDFAKIFASENQNRYLCYYFVNDIYLSNQSYYADVFNGEINGNNHYIQNVMLNEFGTLFGEIVDDSRISNLNIYANFNLQIDSSFEKNELILAGLTKINNGTLSNVNVYYTSANLQLASNIDKISISGIAKQNNNYISNSVVSMDFTIDVKDEIENVTVNEFYFGGITETNTGLISGTNYNYSNYYSQSMIQDYQFEGSVIISEKLKIKVAEDEQDEDGKSAIGGIAAINLAQDSTEAIIGAYEDGVAVDVDINAKSIDNVGGIVGINYSIVKNSLAKVNILASSNAGGIAGSSIQDNKQAEIRYSIVELYQDVIQQNAFAKIEGIQNIGGVVGKIQNSNILHSYIKSYADGSYIKGNVVGGVVGSSKNAQINSCFADIDINGINSNSTVGGISAVAESTSISKAYYIGSLQGEIVGSVFGKVLDAENTKGSSIDQFYSPSPSIEFVGEALGNSYNVTQSYGYNDDLKNISTYFVEESDNKTWLFASSASQLSGYDWYLDAAINRGYPVLIYNSYTMQKLMPTEINIYSASNHTEITDVIFVYTNATYTLSNLISVETNGSSKSNIYVFASEEGILSTKNSTNKLNTKTTLRSSNATVLTLTFVLGNNPSITKQIQIGFIDKVQHFKVENIDIKKGEASPIKAEMAFELDQNNNPILKDVTGSYKIGLVGVSEQLYTEKYFDNFEISSLTFDNVNGEDVALFDYNSVLTGKDSFNNQFNVKLYYVLNYNNLEPRFIEVASYDEFIINIYAGASGIQITNTNIDMTLIDNVAFTLTLKTDNAHDKILINLNSTQIYTEITKIDNNKSASDYENDAILVTKNSVIGDENSKLILSVLEGPDYSSEDLVVTFGLKFSEEYLNSNNFNAIFNQIFTTMITFSDIEQKVSTNLNVTAKPQNLLKIDLMHYPVGEVKDNFFKNTSVAGNTLTPGQVGLLAIDIYPEYAQYEQIEIISGSDNKGNKISFIQVAYIEGSDKDYVEIRPSSVLTENGVILQRISNYNSENSTTSFDGKFYVKTLMGSNVDYDQVITLDVVGVTFIKDENGNIIEEHTVSRSMDILVNEAPSLKLEFNGEKHKAFVQHKSIENAEKINKQYNLVTAGDTLDFDISYQKLAITNLSRNIKAYNLATGEEIEDIIDIISSQISGNKLFVQVRKECPSGILVVVQIAGQEIVNDYYETYQSNIFEFVIVDYIITGVDVNNGMHNFVINEFTPVKVNIKTHSGTDQDAKDYESVIDKDSSYWYGIQKSSGEWQPWNLNGGSNKNDFDCYEAYQLDSNELGLIAIKQRSLQNYFKVQFSYYYNFFTDEQNNEQQGLIIKTDAPADCSTTKQEIITMNLVVVTDIDNPVPIYTIEEFYNMKNNAEIDYILMNDLYFGISESESYGKENGTYTTESYTPFALNVKSLDGNINSIYIYGNMNIDSGETNMGLFTQVSADTILVNLDIRYYPNILQETDSTKSNSNVINFESNLDIQSLNFGGLTAQNFGVISNCNVYFNGDVYISLKNATAQVNIAGFASQNSGKITYSSVFGTNWNDDNSKSNVKLQTKNPGQMAAFVNTNSNLISNCQTEFVGLHNDAPASLNAKVAGFVTNNTGSAKILNSSVAGQRFTLEDDNNSLYPLNKNDERLVGNARQLYFARLFSQSNIGAFVYTNSGMIRDAYASIPMETQSRTAGFVYDNSNNGNIRTSYTLSVYDGISQESSAHTPFVGTNELGEVLNDSKNCIIQYCYYLTTYGEIYKQDPATRIDISEGIEESYFAGFDIGNARSSTWTLGGGQYLSLTLLGNKTNQDLRNDKENGFKRKPVNLESAENNPSEEEIKDSKGRTLRFPRANSNVPYTIANALQFINTFTIYSDKDQVLKRDIRLINDIDLSEYVGTDEFNKIKNTIYIGDFDGNGMTISNIKISGSVSSSNKSDYSMVTDSYGLFYQIGTAIELTKNDNGEVISKKINFNMDSRSKTSVRNLSLKVNEVARSTSTFTGILAGVIVNTDIKSLSINATDVTVLGKNAVGGVAGAIIGNSILDNISVNANVTSTYLGFANNRYNQKALSDVNVYKYISYDSTFEIPFDLKQNLPMQINKSNGSYAGGIAGIIDLYSSNIKTVDGSIDYENNSKIEATDNSPNAKMLKVSGNVTIIGEIVGGLAAAISDKTFIVNSKFELSDTDQQRLLGFYTSGGLVGINNGGIIYLSSVELSQTKYADNDNNLTNHAGESLFRSDLSFEQNVNTYPFAIGGIVGIQQGGYLISSYSKTNVINLNARFAGGVIGYLQYIQEPSSSQNRYNIYPLLEEIYTTGNVLAADGYELMENTITYNDKLFRIASPLGYAGGIVGGYKPSKYDQFNGVVGINAFHQPANYTVSNSNYLPISSTTVDSQGKYSTQNLIYSNLATGYYGAKELSNGTQDLVYFKSKIGAIFGEILTSNNAEQFEFKQNTQSGEKNNLFTKFVYNSSEISNNDCLNNGNGKEIEYYAENLLGEKYVIKDVDSYTTFIKAKSVQVILNSNEDKENSFSPAETYLVFRGVGTKYVEYHQDRDGVYSNWSENWEFKSPIYPVFKLSDIGSYTDIENEYQLRNITSGGKYRIIKDIYLTEYWDIKSLLNTTLISAKREDGNGIINESNLQSNYYAIYNINIVGSQSVNVNEVGFFKNLANCKIKNINFVFGTNFRDPFDTEKETKFNNGFGFNISTSSSGTDDSKKVGLIAGALYKKSIINGCKVYLNNGANVSYQINSTSSLNYGGFTGYVDDSGIEITTSCIVMGQINEDVNAEYKQKSVLITNIDNNKIKTNISSENSDIILNVGGLFGCIENPYGINYNYAKGFNIDITAGEEIEVESVNFGGFVGAIDNNNSIIENNLAQVNIVLSNIKFKSSNNTNDSVAVNIGGFAGKTDGGILKNSSSSGSIELNNIECDGEIILNIGGFIGEFASNGSIECCSAGTVDENDKLTSQMLLTDVSCHTIRLGGFAGHLFAKSIRNSKASFSIIKIGEEEKAVNVTRVQIGGFVGSTNAKSTDVEISNSLSLGNIEVNNLAILQGENSSISSSISGFIADGNDGASNTTNKTTSINQSVASADIYINSALNSNSTIKISGFAGDNVNKIENSVSLGNISYTNNLLPQNCYIGGFTTLDNVNGWTNNYSLSSVKAIANNNSDDTLTNINIRATSFDDSENDLINYCYNLSGVMETQNHGGKVLTYEKLLLGDGYGSNKTIGAREQVSKCIKNFVNEYNYITTGSSKNNPHNTNTEYFGTKLYPYVVVNIYDSNNSTNLLLNNENNKKGKYFYVSDGTNLNKITEALTNISGLINANIIANNNNVAITFKIPSQITVNKDAMISGIEFTTDEISKIDSIISINSGYIFNCLTTGRILRNDQSQNTAMSGFVYQNDGIINASLSMTFVDANNKNISTAGFVIKNNGIIANSSATNMLFNITNDNSITHSGFVDNNSEAIIINSFAGVGMFDVNVSNNTKFYNTNNFVGNNMLIINSTIKNCFYDAISIEPSDTLTLPINIGRNSVKQLTHSNCITTSDFISDTNNPTLSYIYNKKDITLNIKLNYGYPAPTSFTKTSGNLDENLNTIEVNLNKYDIATYFTGNNTESKPYLVNNIGRYLSLSSDVKNSSSQKIYLKLLNNINATQLTSDDINLRASLFDVNRDSKISIKNTNVYAFYNITVSVNSINNCIGLFSANTIDFENFGVVGKFNSLNNFNAQIDSSSSSASLMVANFKKGSLNNCYSILTSPVQIRNASYFGLLVGQSISNAEAPTITNCMASGDIVVSNSNPMACGILAGLLMDGISGEYDINNNLATGSITLSSVNTTKPSESHRYGYAGVVGYMGGQFNNNLSVVSILNKTIKLNSDIGVDAIANKYPNGGTYTNNYYDEYISLTTSAVTDASSNKTVAQLKSNPFGIDSSWTVGIISNAGKHFPIQKVFKDSNIVYKLLNIDTNEETGSRMSPIKITSNDELAAIENTKCYYLSQNFSSSSQLTTNPTMFIGDGYTISDRNNTTLFNASNSISTIISGLTLNGGPVVDNFNGYAYKDKVKGDVSSSYGFANNADSGAVFDACVTDGTLTSNNDKVSGFTLESKNSTKFKNITMYSTFTSTSIGDAVYYSGLTGGSGILIGTFNINLNVSSNKSTYVGGISGSKLNNSINIDNAKINIKDGAVNIDTNNVSYRHYNTTIGLLFGKIYSNTTITNKNLFTNNKITFNVNDRSNITGGLLVGEINSQNCTFEMSSTDEITLPSAVWKIEGSTGRVQRIGGIIGNLSRGNIQNITAAISLEVVNESSNSRCYVGGIVGDVNLYSKMYNITIKNKFNGVLVKIESSQSTCYVGGIAGKCQNVTIDRLESQISVYAFTRASQQYKEFSDSPPTYIYDAKSWGNGENYKSNYVEIPLAVGGVIGRCDGATISNNCMTKTGGNVAAYSVGSEKTKSIYFAPKLGDDVWVSYGDLKRNDWYTAKTITDAIRQQTGYAESFRVVAGGFVGLYKGTSTSYSEIDLGKVSPSTIDGSDTANILIFNDRGYEVDGAPDKYLALPANITYKARSYRFEGINDSNVYLAGSTNQGTGGFNYFETDHSRTGLKLYNSRTKVVSDIYQKANSLSTDFNALKIIPNTGDVNNNYLYYAYHHNTHDVNAKALYYNYGVEQGNISSDNTMVFAGIQLGDDIYNMSYWLSLMNKGNASAACAYFYPTQHWAGTTIGGVISA